MEAESPMRKAARIYLMNIARMVELDDVSEADRQELTKNFGVFLARLIRLAESMDVAPDKRRERNGMEVALNGTPEEIARLLGANDRQWISAESRTPETPDPVIICRRLNGKLVTGVGSYVGRWRIFGSSARKVEFWRPLPCPPLAAPTE